jgi:hypothetical protein
LVATHFANKGSARRFVPERAGLLDEDEDALVLEDAEALVLLPDAFVLEEVEVELAAVMLDEDDAFEALPSCCCSSRGGRRSRSTLWGRRHGGSGEGASTGRRARSASSRVQQPTGHPPSWLVD